MNVISDSYMGIFLPVDIYERISKFITSDLNFPFVKRDELVGIFFLFGKKYGVKNNLEVLSVKDIARRTIDQLKREVYISRTIIDSNADSIKENCQRRILQIYVELQNISSFDENSIRERIIRDPSILMSCYSQHIAYYKQKFFFEIFDPFKRNQINENLVNLLLDRMVMLSYNCEKPAMLPFNSLTPFIKWIEFNN